MFFLYIGCGTVWTSGLVRLTTSLRRSRSLYKEALSGQRRAGDCQHMMVFKLLTNCGWWLGIFRSAREFTTKGCLVRVILIVVLPGSNGYRIEGGRVIGEEGMKEVCPR